LRAWYWKKTLENEKIQLQLEMDSKFTKTVEDNEKLDQLITAQKEANNTLLQSRKSNETRNEEELSFYQQELNDLLRQIQIIES